MHQARPPISNKLLARWLELVAHLPDAPNAEHLYKQSEIVGRERFNNLREYMRVYVRARPTTLLVGEAPGYIGTRRTGIPFVSEDILRGGIPGAQQFFSEADFRLASPASTRRKENTSAAVWQTILKCNSVPLMWAAYPHHPHQPGNYESNRSPTRTEVAMGTEVLLTLIELFQIETVIAVGNVAANALESNGIEAEKVRHPARGGNKLFDRQMKVLLGERLWVTDT
jgi:uracil-DNA glycosylase